MPKLKLPKLFETATFEDFAKEINTVLLDAERMFEDFDKSFPVGVRHTNYPPRNIVKTETGYVISLAVAGFKREELTVVVDSDKVLTIEGKKVVQPGASDADYLFRGIATRQFVNKLQLLDNDEVQDVKLEDGILSVNILRKAAKEPVVTTFEIK